MNPGIQKLCEIANRPSRLIIGLMSGTSLDGLDIALCRITGNGPATSVTLLNFETVVYSNDIKAEIQSVFSKKNVDLEKLTLLHPWIALQHAAMIKACLKKWNINPETIDLVASHGQTVYHAPKSLHRQSRFGNATLQIGDGDHLAHATGIITLSDFRQKNIAAGGQGAPLAIYGDFLLFGKPSEDRILLNIGGIANFTWLPADGKPENIVCTDVGPGNTLMDAYTRENYDGISYDKDSVIAKAGTVNEALLNALKENDFFLQDFPKTTGPELFNLKYLEAAKQKSKTTAIPKEDIMTTLNRFTADTIVAAIKSCTKGKGNVKIYGSGGGIHNPLLMQRLQEELPECGFYNTNDYGINADAKEAVLFALLANETVAGNYSAFASGSSSIPAVAMGKISLPY